MTPRMATAGALWFVLAFLDPHRAELSARSRASHAPTLEHAHGHVVPSSLAMHQQHRLCLSSETAVQGIQEPAASQPTTSPRPQLSQTIVYGDGTGTGRLGVGMTLSGLSPIVPCRRTVALGGTTRRVDFKRGNAYCLDGQTLVPDASSSSGQHTYHTEVETFQRITAIYEHDGDLQPSSFTVWQPDGRVATYQPLYGTLIRGIDEKVGPTPDTPKTMDPLWKRIQFPTGS
jgi:hypothetical protein